MKLWKKETNDFTSEFRQIMTSYKTQFKTKVKLIFAIKEERMTGNSICRPQIYIKEKVKYSYLKMKIIYTALDGADNHT